MKLLHISDLHFGPSHVEEAGRAILSYASTHPFGAAVVTGDLTQRARVSQFTDASAFLGKLKAQMRLVVIPGNHDIPLYRVWERLFCPYQLFQSLITNERNSVLPLEKVTLVGLDSTHPLLRITNGRLGKSQLGFAKNALLSAPAGNYRIVAVHHPLCFDPNAATPGGLVEQFLDWGVDLVLSGHCHTRIAKTVTDSKGRSLILAQCGTSSSSRGRGNQLGKNSFNEIELTGNNVIIRTLEFNLQSKAFKFAREDRFERKVST